MKYRVHTDGGSRGNPGPAAVGIVIEDENDTNVWQYGEAIGVTTNNIAEHTAVLRALEYIQKQSAHIESVEFFLDSLLVVEQLSRRYKIKKEELKQIADASWRIIAALPCPVSFTHVLRHKNKQADALVNQALDSL